MALNRLDAKHIPTLLGLFILAIGLVGGILFVNNANTNSFLPRASPETTPKSLKITNVTDTSFTVSWVTDNKTPGYVRYGTLPSDISTTVTDDRDQISGDVGLFKTHHITLRSLQPNTTYYFKVGTGTQELYDDNGAPYQTQTAGGSTQSAKTLYGEIQNADGTASSGALIYVTSDNLAPLSTISQTSGGFVLSLATARSKDLNGAALLTDDTKLSFLVISPTDDQSSLITIPLADAQPVPEIVIGTNKDYTLSLDDTEEESFGTTALSDQSVSKFTTQLLSPPTESAGNQKSLSFTYPSSENEAIALTQPAFSGTAPQDSTVKLTVNGPSAQSSTVTSDEEGVWTYTPQAVLQEGGYSLTASVTTAGGTETITRIFTIKTTPATTPMPTATAEPVIMGTGGASAPSTDSADIVAGSLDYTLAVFAGSILIFLSGLYMYFDKEEKSLT